MIHFGAKTQMRTVERFSKENRNLLKNSRILVLEHILPTTAEFLSLLIEVGAEIHSVIAKPYSIETDSLEKIKRLDVQVIVRNTYKEIEEESVPQQLLLNALEKSERDNKRIVIIDVGGYFAQALCKLDTQQSSMIAGVVEDTTFGHFRYLSALGTGDIKVPIFSVARSELKEIEARFVGRDAVISTDFVLRELGISITGRKALVIGYGMIGKNVARTLTSYDLDISVYDIEDRRLVQAFTDGFRIHKKLVLLRENPDIIFSATGSEARHKKCALSLEDIATAQTGVVLASVGSRNTEFDMQALDDHAQNTKKEICSHIDRYTYDGKDIYVIEKGTAVNFISKSIPIEILDLVFSEILLCCLRLLNEDDLETGFVQFSERREINQVSWDWLKSMNRD
jgi:adenosylhomocysteinase